METKKIMANVLLSDLCASLVIHMWNHLKFKCKTNYRNVPQNLGSQDPRVWVIYQGSACSPVRQKVEEIRQKSKLKESLKHKYNSQYLSTF